MSPSLHRSASLVAKKPVVVEQQPTLEEWEELLIARETFHDLIEDSRMPSTRKHALLNCAEFYEYAATQVAFLAYYPRFRAAVCAKADKLTVEIEDGPQTRAALSLAAALMAFQGTIGAIYTHRLLRHL